MNPFRPASVLVLASMALVASSQATFTFAGAQTAASPTFNRPSAGNPPSSLSSLGTRVFYAQILFTVDVTGTYAFAGNAVLTPGAIGGADDGFGVLYQGPLDPADPLANALLASDDANANTRNYGFSYDLTAGTTYTLVSTTLSNGATGTFADTITGPGNVQAVPEPATLAALGLGAVAILRRRKRA